MLCSSRQKVLPCIPRLNTKYLMKDITNQMKGLSLKVVKGHRKKSREAKGVDTVADANEGMEEEEEEWIAEPEPGVLITLMALANGCNRLKKIRFSDERFDTLGAQRWWSDNYEKLVELYSIHQENQPSTPTQSEDEMPIDAAEAPEMDGKCSGDGPLEGGSTTPAAEGESENEATEWVVEDEPGVLVTIRALPDGSKELLRVELSRERFGEVRARVWWEENKARLKKQYSS